MVNMEYHYHALWLLVIVYYLLSQHLEVTLEELAKINHCTAVTGSSSPNHKCRRKKSPVARDPMYIRTIILGLQSERADHIDSTVAIFNHPLALKC